MFRPIESFDSGHLPVGDGHEIYWEASGNPSGTPVLWLHGGPGGGLSAGYRRHFDPDRFLIVSFEQRGCGRSRPLATDPEHDLATNTTKALVSDIEALRAHLGVESWLLTGASWGTTLALAYAQAHRGRVTGVVLAAVTTTTESEVNWITVEMGRVFPREWERFAVAAHPGRPAPHRRLLRQDH